MPKRKTLTDYFKPSADSPCCSTPSQKAEEPKQKVAKRQDISNFFKPSSSSPSVQDQLPTQHSNTTSSPSTSSNQETKHLTSNAYVENSSSQISASTDTHISAKQKEKSTIYFADETHLSSEKTSLSSNEEPSEQHMNSATLGKINSTSFAREAFHPGKDFRFPKTKVGKQTRCCQSKWFDDYPWLDYNIENDSVTCFKCKTQNAMANLESERCKELAFLETGFRNWKKAPKVFDKHAGSSCHGAALALEMVDEKCNKIPDMTTNKQKADRALNRRCFMEVIEAITFLARQGLALRGDDDDESNLIQFLQTRSKSFPELKKWLSKKRNKYVCHEAQNEVLVLMANSVIRKLLEFIRDNFFSIMADEYTDVANLEQLSFCLRWVTDDLDVLEKFLGFYEIPNISSGTIVQAIKDIHTRYQLTLDKYRGQCYDGASNMLGKSSGVAKQLRVIQPLAPETHCHAHSLSLSVKDTTKNVTIMRDTMGTAGEIIMLIKYSPKREKILGDLKVLVECDAEEDISQPNSILKLSETRWTVRAECFKRVIDNYEPLMKLWQQYLENESMQTDLKARIIGVKRQMTTFELFFGLNIGHRLFSHTDNLSKTLQAEKMSACENKRNALLVLSVLESMRNEDSFNNLYDVIVEKSKSTILSKIQSPRGNEMPLSTHCCTL